MADTVDVAAPRNALSTASDRESRQGSGAMMQFDLELVQVMRAALDEVMQRVPVEHSNQATKAYLAECILKAAGQGRTSFDALVTAAADHIPRLNKSSIII